MSTPGCSTLDNTLYPAASSIWPKIDDRISRYLADLMGLDGISARALQKFYYQRHGTTLRGLIADHSIDHKHFLDFVHDIDRTSLEPPPGAGRGHLGAAGGRKLILTNGSRDHALRTTEQLGFTWTVEDVFDIVAAGPRAEARSGDLRQILRNACGRSVARGHVRGPRQEPHRAP